MSARVGDDAFGQVVLDRLVADGVDARLIKIVKGVPTGTAFVSYNDDGSRDFVYNIVLSAAAQFDGDDETIAALKAFKLDVMHVSGSALSDAQMCAKVLRVCKALHAAGVRISFDPNVRKELIGNPAYFDAVREMIDIAAIFLPSEDDAATLFPGEDIASFAAKLFAGGVDYIVLKKGELGAEGVSKSGENVSLKAHEVEVADPTGAGDCFCATFVALIASGAYSFQQAMRAGQRCGRSRRDQSRADGRQQPSFHDRGVSQGAVMSAHAEMRSIVADNRAGRARGIPSWCTAHPQTLRAILRAHRDSDGPILIEATCNQVNQHGGYTGMTPARFRAFIEGLSREAGVEARRVILGGDHLGPNPWKTLPAAQAMAEAREMVRAYVEAGFDKIHLDASMACADDRALGEAEMAERAALLCAAAESARGRREIVYIIGTEVPIPGGETEALDALAVTRPEAALRTFERHRAAFASHGLDRAIGDVVGLVVQPGVDMGNTQVFYFDKAKAGALSAAALAVPGIVFEAHSTDFQTEAALTDLVASHFAILKVGPSLTFAFREAVVAMAAIEERLICQDGPESSRRSRPR